MSHSWNKVLRPGGKWSGVISKGKTICFTALGEGANLSALLYNAKDLTERYNMPDTLKAQYTSRLTKGNVLMSDNGRVLASITEDNLGWHDTLCGLVSRETIDKRYGLTNYQLHRNEWLRSGQENFAVELVRNGLGVRDIVPNINFFSKVFCDELGNMHYVPDHCFTGASVTLRTEMDILLILSNTPNPLDSGSDYPSVDIDIEITDAAEVVFAQDYCVNFRHENRRAFENTIEYYSLLK